MMIDGDRGKRVYFAQCNFGGPIKIGHSINRAGRVAALSLDIPFDVVEIGSIPGGLFREKFLHAWFRADQIRREWFESTPELWRKALQARTCGEIYDIPPEPSRHKFGLGPIKYWLRGNEGRLQELARAAGVNAETLRGYLKRDEFAWTNIVAAFACCVVRAGGWVDWEYGWDVPSQNVPDRVAAAIGEPASSLEAAE